MSDLPFLDLHGNDFERGVEHGRVLKQAISENLETYFKRFNASGLSADNARQEGKKWAEVIAKQNAAYTKEMEGIAEGSGHVLSDIAMLNARYEITFGLMKEEAAVIDLNDQADGCKTIKCGWVMTRNRCYRGSPRHQHPKTLKRPSQQERWQTIFHLVEPRI